MLIEEEEKKLLTDQLQSELSPASQARSQGNLSAQMSPKDKIKSEADAEIEREVPGNCLTRFWASLSAQNRNVHTINAKTIGELTEAEQALIDQDDWDNFKQDVNMKSLINKLDRAIKRRLRLYMSDDPDETASIVNFRKQYSRWKFMKYIALTLYITLPFMEKPGWCLHNSEIVADSNTGYSWYCQNADRTIANSDIPKLPANVLNPTYICCLIILFYFTKARDFYRQRDTRGDTVTLQLWLIALATINLAITEVFLNINWNETARSSFIVTFFIYPYINAFARPLIFVLQVRSVKSFWRRYLSVIKGSLPMVIFILLYVFYFAWMGNRLFKGTIEGVQTFSNLNDSFFYMFVCLTTSNYPDVMLPSYGQHRRYAIFFIFYLVIGLFMLMNLLLAIFYSNYQERVESSIDKMRERRSNFFILLFRKHDLKKNGTLCKEGVRNFIKEIHSLDKGLDHFSNEIDMTDLQFQQIFKVVDKNGSGTIQPTEVVDLLQAYETWQYEKQYKASMEELYAKKDKIVIAVDKENAEDDDDDDKKEKDTSASESVEDGKKKDEQIMSFKLKAHKLLSSPQYELAMNIITILNVFTVFFRALQQSASQEVIKEWIVLELVINLVMLIEMISDISVAGPIKAYRNHFRIWPETLCQLLNLPAMIRFFVKIKDFEEYNYTVKIFEVIVFIRMLKLLTLLYEVKTMRIIFETLKNLLGPLNNLIIVMGTIFYVFAQLGMIMFGGQIRQDSPQIVHDSSIPDNYYLMNFNDLLSAYITLFVLIVVNNWYVIVAMCVDIKGGATIYRYFFVIFYYFGVIIGLNIIIAFAIDMYAAVQRLEEQKDVNRKFLLELADKQLKEQRSRRRRRKKSENDSEDSYDSAAMSKSKVTIQ